GTQPAQRRQLAAAVGRGAAEHRGRVLLLEAGAQDGQPPQEVAVRGRQLVDAGRNQALDRVREVLDGGATPQREEQLEEEERAAVGPRGERVQLAGEQRRPGRRRLQELPRVVPSEWLQLEARDGREFWRHEALVTWLAAEQDQPRLLLDVGDESGQQVAGGLVHPLRVLDEEEGGFGAGGLQQGGHGCEDASRAELVVQLGDLGGLLQGQTKGYAEQRQPRGQLRCGGAHQFGKPGCARRGIGVVHAPGGAEEGTEREVGGRRLVEPALGPDHSRGLRDVEQLLKQTGLAHADLRRDLDHPAAAGRRVGPRRGEETQLRVTADEWRRGGVLAVSAALDRKSTR